MTTASLPANPSGPAACNEVAGAATAASHIPANRPRAVWIPPACPETVSNGEPGGLLGSLLSVERVL